MKHVIHDIRVIIGLRLIDLGTSILPESPLKLSMLIGFLKALREDDKVNTNQTQSNDNF